MQRIKKNRIILAGILLGAIAGFLYWKYVGCASGTCYIQSDPLRMSLYGAITGGLTANLFQPKKEKREHEI